MDQFADVLDRFATAWQGPLRAVVASFAAGLLMRCGWRLRTLPALAVLGAVAVVGVFRERAVGVFAISLVAFGYVRLIGRVGPDRRWRLAVLGIVALVTAFLVQDVAVRTATPDQPAVALAVWVLLDMILLLRVVLFVWEFGAQRFERPDGVEYLAWALLPFTCQGPFLRYSEFQRQRPWKVSPLPPLGRTWWADVAVRAGMLVAAVGLAYAGVVLEARGWPGRLAVMFTTSPWGWYLTAAAFFGLYRQAGALGGVAVPLNFNSPFRSRSISEFWTRWNITATTAFRDMLFFNRWGLANPNLYLNTMIVFLAVGLWHSVNGYWVLFGLMHGLGFCVFILWRKWRGPTARPLPFAAGWALTYVFVCSCWAVPPQILKLLGRLTAL